MNPRIVPELALITMALLGVAPLAIAQAERAALPPEILACADESDVMLRLSCYDREIAEFRSRPVSAPAPLASAAPMVAAAEPATTIDVASAAGAVNPATETVAAAPARATNSIDNFGFDSPQDEVTSDVARLRERPYGELIIYLENGQIWEQKHLDRRFRLKTGESVTISKGAVAGYRLSGNSNRSIQVERLK